MQNVADMTLVVGALFAAAQTEVRVGGTSTLGAIWWAISPRVEPNGLYSASIVYTGYAYTIP
jgi:hypothetical protein